MTIDFPITILASQTNTIDSSFQVSGVFWLSAPANSIVPNPKAQSQIPNVSSTDLANLRSGSVIEQTFISGWFPSGTTSGSVQSSLITQQTAAQTALTNLNPPLSGLVGTQYNGSTWANIAAVLPSSLPATNQPTLVTETQFAAAFNQLPNVFSSRATGYVGTSA